MLHWCFICLGLQLIHCLELFSRPITQNSILQDLLFACSQCENLIIRYFNACHPFPDQYNGITYICFNSPIHSTKTLRSIWKPYVQTEVNKGHLISSVSVRKCWEPARSASADTVHDDNMPIPTFLVSPGQTQRIPLIVQYLPKQTKRKWVSVTCSHVTKIQKIETSTIWETCKAWTNVMRNHLHSLECHLNAKRWPGLSPLEDCVSYAVTEQGYHPPTACSFNSCSH